MNDALKGVFEIATLLIGVATLALLINRSGDTAKVVQTTGGVFNTLLETVTLQNGRGY
jgi:hypothetical protein